MQGDVKVCHTRTGGDELFGNYGKWVTLEGGFLRRLLTRSFFNEHGFERRFFDAHYYMTHNQKTSHIFDDSIMPGNTSLYLFKMLRQFSFASENPRDSVMVLDMATQLPEGF